MAINVLKGNVTIHNLVEKGGKVENHYNGTIYQGNHDVKDEGETTKSKPLSLYEVIDSVLPNITSTRIWFAVFKAFEKQGKIAKKDFAGFKETIETTYTEPLPCKISTSELSDMYSLSFRFWIDEWDINDAPIRSTSTFNAYKDLAQLTFDLLDAVK